MSGAAGRPGLQERLLLALFPPGSAEAAVCSLQETLFSRHGFVSSVALAPLIPLLFVAPSAEPRAIEGLGRRLPTCRFSVTGVHWEGGGLWLDVDSGGAWSAPCAEARALFPPDAAAPLFPPAQGFPLGCWEAVEETRPRISVDVPSLRFSLCTLALARITVREGAREWWREAYLETLAERPLRAARRR